jgi:hypothetical protein
MMAATPDDGACAKRRTVKPDVSRTERSLFPAATSSDSHPAPPGLWEGFLTRENLARALKRVEHNHGAPGPDGMRTEDLRPWLKATGRKSVLVLTRHLSAAPVRRVFIPPGARRLSRCRRS